MGFDDIFPNGLSVDAAVDVLEPLTVYVIGMAVYSLFVFNFYRFVAQRDMFAFDLTKFEESRHRALRSFLHFVMYVLKYLIVFPLFAFFWFAVLTAMLTFLSDGRLISEVLLIALATVSAIRFSAYYNEDLSRDLAKILPFAILALFIIDATFLDIEGSIGELEGVSDHWETIAYYLVFLIGLEFVLRFGFGVSYWMFWKRPVRARREVGPVTTPTPEDSESGDEIDPEKEAELKT